MLLDGVALLIADPPQCNTTIKQNQPFIIDVYCQNCKTLASIETIIECNINLFYKKNYHKDNCRELLVSYWLSCSWFAGIAESL